MATRNRSQRVAAMTSAISGFGDKARKAASQYKASPRSVGYLQPAQFGWFQKPQKTMMDVYPWSGGKHRAGTSAQSAARNANPPKYEGRHRGADKEGLAAYI